ncbi:acyltransferase family protein [Mycolicibacterium mengxianglii]|uniref:acyltransferase family protein n=1 Tax=Mycolicibacterium mengxianglii TaxID=2736649 RepID=UPI0018D09548|nr:acyltransferase [Mycolicibacterium mengxianglii]
MTTALERYQESSWRRRKRAQRQNHRLDLQGLRMVAVLAVFANHLWGWPQGGVVGVDLFFVITGFLITASLLRDGEQPGVVSLKRFYWTRLRRVLPAASLVLILTYATSTLVLTSAQVHEVGQDAALAAVFVANWQFASDSAAGESMSPLAHYWAVSIEQQFYLVWPLLILGASLMAVRKAAPARRKLAIGAVIGVTVAASLAWALYETATAHDSAYFNTFARVWEFGIGALLATAAGALARIPDLFKPLMSWFGLLLIGVSLFYLDMESPGFPAPWAILPVCGAGLVIAAGVGFEPRYQWFLTNRVSTYIGNLSYSLYLVHWPVIILIGAIMASSNYFYVTVLTVSCALAVACYHFVETPLRNATFEKIRDTRRAIDEGVYHVERSSKAAAVAALVLLTVGLISYAMRPEAYDQSAAPAELISLHSSSSN